MRSIFLDTNHLFLRAPDGGVENVAAMKAAGFGAIFCNVGDAHGPDTWQTVRLQAKSQGVVCGPWLRTANENHMFMEDKLDYLITVADAWDAPMIVNSESEMKGSGDRLTKLIAEKVGKRDMGLSVEAWPFSDVEWYHLRDYPVLIQTFPQEAGAGKQPDACRAQWYAYGMQCALHTFGSYWQQDPNTFKRLSPYGVYTADDCGGNFAAWAPQGAKEPCQGTAAIKPKPPEEVFMAEIGSQHGITAFVDWLQKQPSVPKRGSGYKKDDLTTWPWPEKLERTLNMLREDHDKRN